MVDQGDHISFDSTLIPIDSTLILLDLLSKASATRTKLGSLRCLPNDHTRVCVRQNFLRQNFLRRCRSTATVHALLSTAKRSPPRYTTPGTYPTQTEQITPWVPCLSRQSQPHDRTASSGSVFQNFGFDSDLGRSKVVDVCESVVGLNHDAVQADANTGRCSPYSDLLPVSQITIRYNKVQSCFHQVKSPI
jgi:hypothetical protein